MFVFKLLFFNTPSADEVINEKIVDQRSRNKNSASDVPEGKSFCHFSTMCNAGSNRRFQNLEPGRP
jgi:hypothetical protein